MIKTNSHSPNMKGFSPKGQRDLQLQDFRGYARIRCTEKNRPPFEVLARPDQIDAKLLACHSKYTVLGVIPPDKQELIALAQEGKPIIPPKPKRGRKPKTPKTDESGPIHEGNDAEAEEDTGNDL